MKSCAPPILTPRLTVVSAGLGVLVIVLASRCGGRRVCREKDRPGVHGRDAVTDAFREPIEQPTAGGAEHHEVHDEITASSGVFLDAGPPGGVVGQEVPLKDLQQPGDSGGFVWATVDLAGTSTEGEAAYTSPCGVDASKTSTFVKPVGYHHFSAQVGSIAQSPPTTVIRFDVLLDNSVTPANSVEATLTSPQSFDLDLDPGNAGALAIKATLLQPPPNPCNGGPPGWCGARRNCRPGEPRPVCAGLRERRTAR